MRSSLITVLKTMRLNCSSNGSLLFWHRLVLKLKEPWLWEVHGFPGQTIRSSPGFKTLDSTRSSTLLFFSPSTIILMPHCWSSAACHLPCVCHQIWVNHLLFSMLFHYEIFLLSFAATHLSFFKNKFTYSFILLDFFLFSNIPKIHLYSFTCYKPVYLFGNLHLNNNFRPILSKCLNMILKVETTHFKNSIF